MISNILIFRGKVPTDKTYITGGDKIECKTNDVRFF